MQNIIPTFNFITIDEDFFDLPLPDLIDTMSEYYAQNGDCDSSVTCTLTGQLVFSENMDELEEYGEDYINPATNPKLFVSKNGDKYSVADLVNIPSMIKWRSLLPITYYPNGLNDSEQYIAAK